MSAYFPPKENVPIFDAVLFSIENNPITDSRVGFGTSNLDFVQVSYPQIFKSANLGTDSVIFPQILTIPSAGTWNIIGNLEVYYPEDSINIGQTKGYEYISYLTSAGSGSPFMTYLRDEVITAYSANAPIEHIFSIEKTISVASPDTIRTEGTFNSAPNGVFFLGSLSAVKINNTP